MDVLTYPGKGLSLSQLMFALNEELKRVACSSSFALDEVSEFDRDLSIALTAVREWKNSFAPINRIPLDILSLIPTHLSSNKDRFHATFVCRHWRTTFLRYGVLWSQLFLGNGEEYVTTLLKRANGSALEIVTNHDAPPGTTALLSPHVQQIRYLDFASNCWADILAFSEDNPGPLPLLHTLEIHITDVSSPQDQPNTLIAPSLPLFSGAINLQEFVFGSGWGPSMEAPLKYFVFPNLTTLRLDAFLTIDFNISDVLDFLEASPTLQKVEAEISGNIISEGIPREMVVVLPNVKTFSLSVLDDGQYVFDPAHISCPAAQETSLIHQVCDEEMAEDLILFPDPDSWKAITRQYSTSPVEEITLEMKDGNAWTRIKYSLTFRSSDSTVVRLDCGIIDTGVQVEQYSVPWEEMNLETFSQACRTIRDHPLLSHVKRLHIKNEALSVDDTLFMADVFGELIRSLGPLDELIIHGCHLHAFLAPFVGPPESRPFERVFPTVKRFTASDPRRISRRECMDAVVNLAQSQHELEKPFDRVTIRANGIPTSLAEKLGQWVGTVDCINCRNFVHC